ncbi:unnamed protein product [Blepharisma stoltei]|uniref:Hexose transporter 1 n=1 Tax=Blepharisma stoltei TaxID=1481888 RepID=A0AAU9JZS8_9CILI|nr:unnamed protein product [Blepharisma stoltei]
MGHEDLLPKSFNSKIVWKLTLNATIGSFLFGYNIGVFNSNQENIAATLGWGDNKDLYISTMAATLPLGGLVGSLYAGSLANKVGCRKALMITDFINICGSLFFLIPYTATFGIGRLVTGYSSGSFSTLCPLYIGEISPPEVMGTMGSLTALIIALGVLVAFILALPLPTGDYNSDVFNYWWMFMFVFQAFFALTQLFILWKVYRLDTPIRYLHKDIEEKALESLQQVYTEEEANKTLEKLKFSRNDRSTLSEMDSVETAGKDQNLKNDEDFTYSELICCVKPIRKKIRLGIAISFLQVAGGVDALFTYTAKIFRELGGGVFESRIYTAVFGLANLASVVVVIYIVEKLKRRTLLIFGNAGMGIAMAFLGIFASILSDAGPIPPLFFMFLYVFAFSNGIGTITYVYCGEILTSRAMSICMAINWFMIAFVIFTFPHMVALMTIGVSFWVFGVVCGIGILYFLIEFVETKGLDAEQIKAAFDKYK